MIIILQLFPKYVIYPLLLVLAPKSYIGIKQVSLTSNEINNAILYGAFELFCLLIFVMIFERIKTSRKQMDADSINLQLKGKKNVYFIYILFSLIIYLLVGRQHNIIHFLSISTDISENASNIYIILIKYIVSIGLTIFTLYFFSVNKKKYETSRHKRWVYLSILIAMLYCGFIIGESRGVQIAISLLIGLILIKDYPSYRAKIVSGISIILLLVVFSITLYRTGSASLISEPTFAAYANTLQLYYGGPASIAQSIKVLSSQSLDFYNLIFDFIRSSFPFNLLLKNMGDTTSQIYNMKLYDGLFNHGQIIFSSSYGYIYAGLLGVPVILSLNVFLIFIANKFFYYANSYEMKYLSGYIMIRLIAATLVNTPTILGSVTQYIFTFGLLFYVSKKRVNR